MLPACRNAQCDRGDKPCPTPDQCTTRTSVYHDTQPPWTEPEEIRTPLIARIAMALLLGAALACACAAIAAYILERTAP